MFAICKSPQGYASAAFSVQHRRKKSGCHFCELAVLERRRGGGGGDDATSRARAVGLRAFRGWVQGSPAPQQMCLGVTSHPRKNESPDRCWTSRPGSHASHARTRPAATQRCAGVRRHQDEWLQRGSEEAADVHLDRNRGLTFAPRPNTQNKKPCG